MSIAPEQALVDEVVDVSGRGTSPFGLYVFPAKNPAAELARRVEQRVFLEFFGNTRRELREAYGPYESASMFFCVIDHRRRIPVGAMRVIMPSPRGFKTLHDIEDVWGQPLYAVLDDPRVPLDTSRLWDVASLAVVPEYRGAATSGVISLALYQALCALLARNDIRWLVAVFDLVALDLLQSQLHRPFVGFPGLAPRAYLDSPASLPVYGNVQDYKVRLAFADPDLYEVLIAGRGLGPAVSTPDWDRGLQHHDGVVRAG